MSEAEAERRAQEIIECAANIGLRDLRASIDRLLPPDDDEETRNIVIGLAIWKMVEKHDPQWAEKLAMEEDEP